MALRILLALLAMSLFFIQTESISSNWEKDFIATSKSFVQKGPFSSIPLPRRQMRNAALPPSAAKSTGRSHNARRWGLGVALGTVIGAFLGVLTGGICRVILVWRRSRLSKSDCVIFNHKISPKMLKFLDAGVDQMEVIGKGVAGTVYKTTLEDGLPVAVKRINIQDSNESGRSFGRHHTLAEIETLGHVRHMNLTWLFAYIRRQDAHFLLYELMPNGSVLDMLEDSALATWSTRRKIALNTASGLKYLHHDCNPRILHRDLKTSNILLDDEYNAHLGDFGLAKALPDDMTHVTTAVAGTIGYIAPEYHQTCKFTTSSDVYSFGVVLGVLLCGKEPVDDFFTGTRGMVEWMRDLVQTGNELNGIDPKLLQRNNLTSENSAAGPGANTNSESGVVDKDITEMKLAMRIACHCTRENAGDRPSMKDVLMMLNPGKLAVAPPMSELLAEQAQLW